MKNWSSLPGPFLSSCLYHYEMVKTSFSFDLALTPPKRGAVLFRWLCDEIRSAILDGRLKRGTRLPATRQLARHYRLSRGTVVTAFEQLHAEGYLEGQTG